MIFTYKDVEYLYYVNESFLYCFNGNSKIFDKLGMSENEKNSFAKNHYGYFIEGGSWPEFKVNDYEALRSLLIAIYELIDKKEGSPDSSQERHRSEGHQSVTKELVTSLFLN